jgi:hypothetical protein
MLNLDIQVYSIRLSVRWILQKNTKTVEIHNKTIEEMTVLG